MVLNLGHCILFFIAIKFYKYLYCLNFNTFLYLFTNLYKEKLVNCFNLKK